MTLGRTRPCKVVAKDNWGCMIKRTRSSENTVCTNASTVYKIQVLAARLPKGLCVQGIETFLVNTCFAEVVFEHHLPLQHDPALLLQYAHVSSNGS